MNARNLQFSYAIILLTLVMLSACSRSLQRASSEKLESLIRFESDNLFGYKNAEEEVLIDAQYSRADAIRFDDLIVVSEENGSNAESYYLNRAGKKFGSDQVYTYSYSFDCEREGHIRFKEAMNGYVGLFNRQGKIAIPAIYDDLSPVTYGLVTAIKNAEKSALHSQQTYSFGYKYFRDHLSGGCNHISWSGGIKLLLNIENEILVKNFNYKGRLDYGSMEIKDEASLNSTKESFKGVNGKYYIFTNIEEDFKDWFYSQFFSELDVEKLKANSLDSIMYYKRPDGWTVESAADYFLKNASTLIDRMTKQKSLDSDFTFRLKELSPLTYDNAYFSKYFNNCNKSMKDKYPILEVLFYQESEEEEVKTLLKFIKDESGYKIYDVRLE